MARGTVGEIVHARLLAFPGVAAGRQDSDEVVVGLAVENAALAGLVPAWDGAVDFSEHPGGVGIEELASAKIEGRVEQVGVLEGLPLL